MKIIQRWEETCWWLWNSRIHETGKKTTDLLDKQTQISKEYFDSAKWKSEEGNEFLRKYRLIKADGEFESKKIKEFQKEYHLQKSYVLQPWPKTGCNGDANKTGFGLVNITAFLYQNE